MFRDRCVALPRGAMSLSVVVIVIFPDHTQLLFLTIFTIVTNLTVFLCSFVLLQQICCLVDRFSLSQYTPF